MSSIFTTDTTEALTRSTADDRVAADGGIDETPFVHPAEENFPTVIQTELRDDDNTSRLRDSFSTNLFDTDDREYEMLANEYLSLMDKLVETEEVIDRRKTETSRLSLVLTSKEDEYTDRKERVDRMHTRLEKLEAKLQDKKASECLTEDGKRILKTLEYSKKEATEALSNSMSMLKTHQETNKELVQTLRQPPAFEEKCVELYLQRVTYLESLAELEEELENLKEEVQHLQRKKKVRAKVAIIGTEIAMLSGSFSSIGPLTCVSSVTQKSYP